MNAIPTLAQVEAIAALNDPALRNLQITQCYQELSAGLLARTGGNANWCTFATWASKQAGQTIRREDLKRVLEGLLQTSPGPSLAVNDLAVTVRRLRPQALRPRSPQEIRRAIWQSLNLYKAIERTSEAVARGNVKVFEEIAWQFARFHETCLSGSTPEDGRIAGFCEALRPGGPPEGQEYLARAFAHLYAAIREPDPRRQAELMLLSNIEIGFHEQTRLQPEIQAALDAPYLSEAEFLQRLLARLFPRTTALALYARALALRLLGRPPLLELAVRALLAEVQASLRQLLTEATMAIGLPGGMRLRLWRDLDGEYPALLRQLTLPELSQMLAQYDPTPDSLAASGAVDWASLPERLHFILDFFRLYQQRGELFAAPYTAGQVAEIKAGKLPQPPL